MFLYHTIIHHSRWDPSGWGIGTSQRLLTKPTLTCPPGRIRTRNPGTRATADPRLRLAFHERLQSFNDIPHTRSWFVDAFAKLRQASIGFVISVSPSVSNNSAITARILMKFDIWAFLKTCSENSNSIKMWQEQRVLYMKKFANLW
jgi:hypothetical protein